MNKSAVLWTLKLLNLIAFLATIVVNVLANALPIAGRNTGELSDLYPNLFVPAGFTFSIWGLIYLLLAIFTVYQLLAPAGTVSVFLGRIGPWFIVSSAANITWIFLWHHEQVAASLGVMLLLLASLLLIYLRLGVGLSSSSWSEKLLVRLPFSIYLGWITVATIANTTALLVHLGWGRLGLSEVFWTVAVLIVAALLTLAVLLTRSDVFYALVVLWAFLGILLKRLAVDSPPSRTIVATLAVCLTLIGVMVIVRFPRWLRS